MGIMFNQGIFNQNLSFTLCGVPVLMRLDATDHADLWTVTPEKDKEGNFQKVVNLLQQICDVEAGLFLMKLSTDEVIINDHRIDPFSNHIQLEIWYRRHRIPDGQWVKVGQDH